MRKQSLAEMRRLARDHVAASDLDPLDVAVRDQVIANWREILIGFGINVGNDDTMLGLVAGLRMGTWAVDHFSEDHPELLPLLHSLKELMFGGQTLLLCMEPNVLTDFDHSERSDP